MNQEMQQSKLDTLKWLFIWTLFVTGVITNYLFSTTSLSLRLTAWLLLLLLMAGVIFQTKKGKQWWLFIEASKVELQKVVWPTRQETIQTTMVVVVMVVISAVFLWGVDALLVKCVQFFMGK